jgi:hypothetical protein
MEFHTPSALEARFLEQVNDFYKVSGFGDFFDRHIPYYLEHSHRFDENVGRHINLDWFEQRGGISADKIIMFVTPIIEGGQSYQLTYGTLENWFVFGSIMGLHPNTTYEDYRSHIWLMAHEIAHSFGNVIGFDWYARSPEFRRWATEAANLWPHDNRGAECIGRELVSDAFAFWYMVENSDYTLDELFTYIQHMPTRYVRYVYEVITDSRMLNFTK